MWLGRYVGIAAGLALLGAAAACGTHNTAAAIRPADPSSNAALGEGACPAEPFTLDMDADQVAKLQRAMRGGIAVIAQDCTKGTFKILTRCSVDGSYVYNGSTLDAETKAFTNGDDLKASFSSPTFVASAAADLQSGVSLSIEYTAAGRTRRRAYASRTSRAPATARRTSCSRSSSARTRPRRLRRPT